MIKIGHYYSMEHRGGLKEALETLEPMNIKLAEILIENDFYRFYCRDERIKSDRYIINNMSENLGFPQWILIADEAIKQ